MLKGKWEALRGLAPGRNQSEKSYESSLTDEEKEDMRLFKENFAAELISRKFPGAPQFLQERLATAMLQRRQHFLYLKWRHCAQPARPSRALLSRLSNTVTPVPSVSETIAPPIRSPRATLNASTVASATFATAQRSVAPKVWASRGKAMQELELAYPPLPSSRAEHICPFCYRSLSEDVVRSDRMWRKHIDEDLKAYVCLQEKCSVPDKTYGQEDWLAHSRRESAVAVPANGEELFRSCPLCNANMDVPDHERRDHIKNHLTFLALKCLPWGEDVQSFPSNNSTPFGSASSVAGSSYSGPSAGSLDFEDLQPTLPPESDEELAWDGAVDIAGKGAGELRQEEWGPILDSKPTTHDPDPLLLSIGEQQVSFRGSYFS
ncbi:uncharacterized protein NECHADRAFT_79845 [Fusarium vanettenii 77-13-4]|uniref:C2H2-type domain-containing protein n=1 Tax=Fusarium vanettenii (strain ATCC MYA-4622 / CBS 123669 / FGSC 9596 / NRRL 45880 / 77-13-4) TaxID=660122 RepID=C7Z0C7_FUSV7|nr:uncharacterized protein NECHADRAFT_79845 [Fusarium vanettenii 77-13-4]EEU42357.1 hypothetical protein NECHADRAFT_79845 [Fusarium vanettenii 77-13-4]